MADRNPLEPLKKSSLFLRRLPFPLICFSIRLPPNPPEETQLAKTALLAAQIQRSPQKRLRRTCAHATPGTALSCPFSDWREKFPAPLERAAPSPAIRRGHSPPGCSRPGKFRFLPGFSFQ